MVGFGRWDHLLGRPKTTLVRNLDLILMKKEFKGPGTH